MEQECRVNVSHNDAFCWRDGYPQLRRSQRLLCLQATAHEVDCFAEMNI